jgi:hypothetical protein
MVDREPARVLQDAWADMTWSLEPGAFALVGFDEPSLPDDLACLARTPSQIVRDGSETTMLVSESDAATILRRHPSARVERDLVWIRFETPMGWEVVGFLARVTGALAAEGVPLGAVCGFSRDHLFVARKHLATARIVLDRLFPRSRSRA